MNYPYEYLFTEDLEIGIIRVKVAAIVICLDHGSIDGVKVPDSETDPYFQPGQSIKDFATNEEYGVWHRAHSFLNIEPKGVLAAQVKKVEAALLSSIANGELTPIQIRADLEGVIDPRETWLNTQDFVDWCDVRSLRFDDSLDQYVSDEKEIYQAAIEAMDKKRLELESSNFQEQLDRRRAELNAPDAGLNLLRENIVLRERAGPLLTADKQLKNRERETLMTIIGVMLELLKTPKPGRDSDAAVINEMLQNYGEKPGIKERTLQEKFPLAKRILMSK